MSSNDLHQDTGSAHRADPAPSRMAYRMQRLSLTPLFRGFLRLGVPAIAALGVGAFLLNNDDARETINTQVTSLRKAFEERPEFMIQAMSIDGASEKVAADIRVILPLDFPQTSFDMDLEDMRRQIADLDPVATASLRVRDGGILQIDVVERVPAVVWRGPEGVFLLDAEGHRIRSLLARAERTDLPLITGAGAEDAVVEARRLLVIATPISNRLRGLVRVGARRWDVVFDRGQRIMLPAKDPVPSLQRVLALHHAQDLLERDITTIDMRLPGRPTLRLAQGAKDELERIRAMLSE